MKIHTFIFLFFIWISYRSNAQEVGCGAVASDEEIIFMDETPIISEIPFDEPIKTFPIAVYVFSSEGDNPTITESQIQTEVNIANSYFAPAKIKFEIISFVSDENNDLDTLYEDQPNQRYLYPYYPNFINLIYVENYEKVDGRSSAGTSVFPKNIPNGGSFDDRIFISHWAASNNETLSHELGHFFGLFHTHEGMENQNCGLEICNVGDVCGLNITHLLDNCESTTDRCCDTGLDPNLGNEVSGCTMVSNCINPNFDNIPVNNLMSYYCDRNEFTTCQILRLFTYSRNGRDYISSSNQSDLITVINPSFGIYESGQKCPIHFFVGDVLAPTVNILYREVGGEWIEIISYWQADIGYNIFDQDIYAPIFYGSGIKQFEFSVEYSNNSGLFDVGLPIDVKGISDNEDFNSSFNLEISCSPCLSGSIATITWNGDLGDCSSRLSYTLDAGISWTVISDALPTDGQYLFQVPNCVQTSNFSLWFLDLCSGQFDVLNEFQTIYQPIDYLDNGIRARYSFDSSTNDDSGNDNDAINMGATPTFDRFGNPNSAYEFDGEEDHMLLLDPDETMDFSMSLWIKNLRGPAEDFQWFLGTNNDDHVNPGFLIGHDRTISTRYGPDNWIAVVLDGVNQSIGYDLGEKELDRWYHLVYTYDVETHLNQFYIDGDLVASGIEQMGSNPQPISLGKQGITDFRHSNIVVDDVRIYDRVLYCSEITEIFDQCLVNLESSLIAHYPFNGNDLDISGNNHHPTFNTATLTSDRFDNPMSAYFFDGTEDQIAISNPFGEIVDDSDPFSISLWFKTSTTKAQADLFSYFTKCHSGNGNTDDDYFSLSILNGTSFLVSNGNNNATIPAGSINDDNFHFLFLTSLGDRMEVYLDNNLLQIVPMTPSEDPIPNYYNFVIGYVHSNNCGDNSRFEGVIDDVRIYGKGINPCEQELVYIECSDQVYLKDLTVSAPQFISARSLISVDNVNLGPSGQLTLTAPVVHILPNNEVGTGGQLFVINEDNCSSN